MFFLSSPLCKSVITALMLFVSMSFSVSCLAGQIEAALHYNFVNSSQDDALSNGSAVSINYLQPLPWWQSQNSTWLFETGLLLAEPSVDAGGRDIAGAWQVQLQSNSANLGLRYAYRTAKDVSIFTRLGLSYWHMTLEVEEYSSIHGGSVPDSENDNGLGYYWGIGAAFDITENTYWLLQLSQYQYLDAFEDISAKPFDLALTSFSIGVNVGF
ncbi:MAG: outer membrane beta-barrel protein [Pseudomonadales bacterium]|nr:outer membrane beta-barrel protein [Pseudomonadales bacterium]